MKLKPLVWEDAGDRRATAVTTVITYDVSVNSRGVAFWSIRVLASVHYHECGSMAEAKRACQADYERRVGELFENEKVGTVVERRDAFAAHALTGMLAYSYVNPQSGNWQENASPMAVAKSAYEYATAMLLAREPEAIPDVKRLIAVLQKIAALADTGSDVHKAEFDPDNIGQRPTGWNVAETMRRIALEVVGNMPTGL